MPDTLSRGLSSLSSMRSSSSEAASSLSCESEEVSRRITDVVSLLQVHDITRQQIEHVMETLEEVASRTVDDEDTLLLVFKEVGDIQIGQLTHARNELVSSVTRVIDDLRGVSNLVSSMSGETFSLVDAAGESGSSFLSELKGSISQVMSSFEKSRGADKDLAVAMESISLTIGEISSFVNDIEDIGSEIELIALNARIKAAHAAEEGAALGVLAEAIRSLSERARGETLAITDSLKGIGDAAGALHKGNREEPEIMSDMERLHKVLSTSHNALLSTLSSLKGETASLTRSIEAVVGTVTAHKRADEVISGVVHRLKEVTALGKRMAPREGNDITEFLKGMASRYTMYEERHIHSGGSPGESLGDNVELF